LPLRYHTVRYSAHLEDLFGCLHRISYIPPKVKLVFSFQPLSFKHLDSVAQEDITNITEPFIWAKPVLNVVLIIIENYCKLFTRPRILGYPF
jgi:hypothetical protein